MALNLRTQPVMATSVGRRSMLDAPKKPTMPLVCFEDVRRVLRLGDRPAVAEHQDVRVHLLRGVVQGLHALRGLVERQRGLRADAPLVVSPMCGISTSAPAFAIASASLSVNT